jgi:hypothetical protein
MAPPTVIAHSAVGRRCRARTIQATRPAIARHKPGHHVHAAIPMVLAASASLRRTSTPCAVSALKPVDDAQDHERAGRQDEEHGAERRIDGAARRTSTRGLRRAVHDPSVSQLRECQYSTNGGIESASPRRPPPPHTSPGAVSGVACEQERSTRRSCPVERRLSHPVIVGPARAKHGEVRSDGTPIAELVHSSPAMKCRSAGV